MNMKKLLSAFALLVSGVVLFAFFGCASTESVSDVAAYEEVTLQKLSEMYGYDNFKAAGYVVRTTAQKDFDGRYYLHDEKTDTDFKTFYADEFSATCPDLRERIEENREYAFYFTAKQNNAIAYLLNPNPDSRLYELHLAKIGGLRTLEEINAEKQAKEDAENQKRLAAQKADEEANRYDPKDFYFLTENFRPADYTEKDLFDAVSIADDMPRKSPNELDFFGFSTKLYFSDVVCAGQNGKYIDFKTDDNAIHQMMKISGRSGLKGGEKVRVYYLITKEPLLEWNVRAIKKR